MKQRIWVITGISSGLGKALAEAVIENGDYVVGTMRQQEQIDEFNKEYNGRASAILLDVTHFNTIEDSIGQILQKHGRIDVLVNNAGVGFAGGVEESSMDEVRKVFEANFFGALKMTQSVLPAMRDQRKGHIVQILSHGGVKAFAGFGIYNASKFALEGFSEALAQEIAPIGIHLSIIEPGPFRTNFAGDGLILAKKEINDYAETAGNFRKKLKDVHNRQEGDPKKAAQAIINHVNSEKPSLRLPLGAIALKTIGMKVNSLKTDLELNAEIAKSAIYGA